MTNGSQSPARGFFDSLEDVGSIEQLISDGEAEGQFLECKSPGSPRIGQDMRGQASRAMSAFANSGGGVLLWGVSTDNHAHSGLDVLSQVEPIGQIRQFAQVME